MKAFFGKIWTWIKSTATKVWKWSVAHKAIAITTAAVVVAGTTCAIVLPIALHEHSYATEWSSDAENHWHDATCKHEEEKSDLAAHTYTNACDTTCDVCGYARTVGAHVYDNACDNKCNVCSAERTVESHVYDNACDTACNVCGATRTITHDHADTLTAGETTHWYACSVCGDKKEEAAHVFDKTVASIEYLKAEATATTKAQYYKSCVCDAKSATEYFETDKTAGTLANIQDLSKTYDKVELANPTYETNSDGAVTIEWYQGDTKLDAKPVNAGTYKVKVIIAESATYTGISAEKEFTIAKVVVTIPTLEKEYDGYDEFEFVFEGPAGEEIDCLVEIGNKNAGTYTDVAITYKSVSSENYEITATTVNAKINKKVLSGLSVDLTYAGTNSFEVPLGAANGILAGDVADGIKVCITFANKNVGAAVTGAGLDADDGDNYTNYELDLTTCTASIVKRPVWAENVEFIYNGYDSWTGEESPNQIVFQNMANGETMDSSFVEWTFDSKNVGATLTSVTFVDDDDGRSNYEIDFSKCSAKIKIRSLNGSIILDVQYGDLESAVGTGQYYYDYPMTSTNEPGIGIVGEDKIMLRVFYTDNKVGTAHERLALVTTTVYSGSRNYYIGSLQVHNSSISQKDLDVSGISFSKEYDGTTTLSKTFTEADGLLSGETFTINVSWPHANVQKGNAQVTTDGAEYAANYTFGGDDLSAYIHNVKNSAEITPKDIDVSEVSFVKEYDKRNGIARTINGVGEESVYINLVMNGYKPDAEFQYPNYVPNGGFNATNYTFGGQTFEKYSESAIATAAIVPKKITNLDIKIMPNAYSARATNETHGIMLLLKDGILSGDDVRLLMVDIPAIRQGSFYLQEKAEFHYEQDYLMVSKLMGDSADCYELATYENEDGNPIYGIITFVSSCDVQYNGTCNCGNLHIDEVLSFPYGESIGANIELQCGQDYEGGIYRLDLEGGRYEILPSDNFATITVYDSKGNKIASDSYVNFATAAGTYYVHIGLNSSTGSSDKVDFKRLECSSDDIKFDGSCVCGTSHLTETLTFTGGEDVGASATIACDSDYEGGIYKIALEGGKYEFSGSDQFFNISGIYDANGNVLATSIGTYALPKGTYYFHVYTGNSPYMDTIWVKKTGKMLDEATMANAIVPDMEPGNSDVGVRIHNLQTHNGGDTFVLFYNVGEDVNALGQSINFRYEDGDGGYSATSNIESIEFYDVNGFQLDVTYDEPDMLAASGVTAVGGVYIVVTMNGEGMDNLYFYAV